MGSRRAVRPSRSHARPRGGPRGRRVALVLGACAVAAGAGIGLSLSGPGGGGAADRVVTSAADEASGAADEANPAAPAGSASAVPSGSASASPGGRTRRGAGPRKPASPSARTTTGAPVSSAPARKTPGGGTGSGSGSGATGGSAAGSGSGAHEGSSPGSGSDSGPTAAGGPEARVLALVNKERAAAGCGPVRANDELTRAADDYSDVMAASGVMSHTGPDGSTMTSRVEAAGYTWSALGENIAQGQPDAASVMDAWMNSPGHRDNILNCAFKELGVGVHLGDGGPWWTQDFGTGR